MALTIICLTCGRPLDLSALDVATCSRCGQRYPMTFGIPDLRGPDAVNSPADAAIVEKMLALYPQTEFNELLDIRLRGALTYDDLRGHEIGYILALDERGREMVAMFQKRAAEYFRLLGKAAALDIGCGSGAGLLALGRCYGFVVGVDPSLPDLLLARKALETAGIANFQLVQAYGQRLPFAEHSFDYINALNVLEHVFEPEQLLGEAFRTLRPDGIFAADSRNRFDLFLPEPHVKIRWVGLVPRGWQKRYVRWRLGVGYDATRLLSYGGLRRGLRRSFGRGYRIVFPYVNAYGCPAWVNPWLRRLERLPLLSAIALTVFPSHLALARKR
jgi:SAM-dependent methyltransferase